MTTRTAPAATPSAVTPVVALDAITKTFPGVKALNQVKLDLYPGQVTALVGENGAGKSTTVKILTGIYKPDGGTIRIDDTPIEFTSPNAASKAGITAIHQETVLFDELSVAENIFIGHAPRTSWGLIDRAAMHRAAAELLDGIGAPFSTHTVLKELGIANKHLVAIAGALSVDGLPSIVVTIGTMSLFRGISFIILGDDAFRGYPDGFAWFGQGYIYWVFTVEMLLFVLIAVIYGVILHKTNFGSAVYAIGNNPTAALFSGIRVQRVKFILFLLTGLMSGVAAICLTSRLGSTRPSIATGMELEVVTMVVLGGVNILGGSGSIPGVVIAAFVMGLVTFGLGLLNVPGIVMSIFIGLLLIGVIALPRMWTLLAQRRAK